MLENFRQAANNKLIKFLLLAIVIAVTLSLVDFSKNKENSVAKIGKDKISVNEFLQAKKTFFASRSNYESMDPNSISSEVINRLVINSLIKQEANFLGIKIADEVIAEYLSKEATFQKNGVFDQVTYENILKNNNVNETLFLQDVSLQISSKFLLGSLTANLPLQNNLTRYLYNYLAEKRKFTILTIDAQNANIGSCDDNQLENYFKKNQNEFLSSETRSFSYLKLDVEKLKNSFVISDDVLKNEYDTNKQDFALAENRDFFHFLAPNEIVANKIVQALEKTQDSRKVADEFIPEKVIAEVFNNQNSQSFVNEIDSSLFALNINQVSLPKKSELGWHVFKVLKIHPKAYKNFQATKADIKQRVINKLLEEKIYNLQKLIEDDLAAGNNFNEIAARYELSTAVMNKIKPDFKGEGLEDIVSLAFQTHEGEESAFTRLKNSQDFVIVKVNQVEAPRLKDFHEAKNDVATSCLKNKRDELAVEISNKLQKESQENKQQLILKMDNKYSLNDQVLENLVKEIYKKNQVKLPQNNVVISLKDSIISRPIFAKDPIFSNMFIDNIFKLGMDKVSPVEKLDRAKYTFVKLNQIFMDKNEDQILFAQLENTSNSNYQNQIYDQYFEYLKSKYKPEINYDLVYYKYE